jgi:hypothetical protein
VKRFDVNAWIRGAIGVAVFAVLVSWAWGLVMLPQALPEPRYAGTILSAASDRILRASCFDCHSNEPRYAWYDRLPVAATLVAWDVIEGQGELNFSTWDRISPRLVAKKLKAMREDIEEGHMPPWYYTPLHREAALSTEAKRQLLADIAAAAAGPDAAPEKDAREHER